METKKHPNADISELHLSDAMIDLLKNGRTYQLLKTSHIDEGEYLNDDMDCIMKDLREAHIGRSDSVAEKSVVEELKQNLEEVMNFNGSRVEKLLMTFCMQTKIKYNKLSEEEKQWLIRMFRECKLFCVNPLNQ